MTNQTRAALEKLRPFLVPDRDCEAAFREQITLADSEWSSPEMLEAGQLRRLKTLAEFAARHVPYWKTRLDADAIVRAGSVAAVLSQIPVLTRSEVIKHNAALMAGTLPPPLVAKGVLQTSGSTGAPVRIQSTDALARQRAALTVRAHIWAGRDFAKSFANIRRSPRGVATYPGGAQVPKWAAPLAFTFRQGTLYALNTDQVSLEQQWEWLNRIKPSYVMTYPSILKGFVTRVSQGDWRPLAFEGLATISEIVDPELRTLTFRHFGLRLQDLYSSIEAGPMAIQCPSHDTYHLQSEAVIVEVVDDSGRACAPGEMGRVLITPLFNFGTPLFRYEIGDFAEAGAPCPCGRGLPVINRIAGRRRNLLVLSDGRRYWPSLGTLGIRNLLDVRQHQFRQTGPGELEVLLVTASDLTPEQESEVRKIVAAGLPAQFNIRVRRMSEIPREEGGKYEEFVSLVP